MGEETTIPYWNISSYTDRLSPSGGKTYCSALPEHELDSVTHFQRKEAERRRGKQCRSDKHNINQQSNMTYPVVRHTAVTCTQIKKTSRGLQLCIVFRKTQSLNPPLCCAQSYKLCLTLCDPKDYNLRGSSVCGIHQTRILEWAAISSTLHYKNNSRQTQLGGPSTIPNQSFSHLPRPWQARRGWAVPQSRGHWGHMTMNAVCVGHVLHPGI